MKQIEKLTDGEEVVMKAVWDCKTAPKLSEVNNRVVGVYGKDWKPQTISTFLAKLVRKGYVKLVRNGKIYTYDILISEDEYRKNRLKHLLIFVYNDRIDLLKQHIQEL